MMILTSAQMVHICAIRRQTAKMYQVVTNASAKKASSEMGKNATSAILATSYFLLEQV